MNKNINRCLTFFNTWKTNKHLHNSKIVVRNNTVMNKSIIKQDKNWPAWGQSGGASLGRRTAIPFPGIPYSSPSQE